jgi:xylulokinase
MYLGIDVGTSSVKVVLVDETQQLIDQAEAGLAVERPQPLWSEQDPQAWWHATRAAMAALHERRARELSGVRGIGLSGQMHGATLLDEHDRVLRPAILWNDGRSLAECGELERRAPAARDITGNLAMPGFTAPKLIWVARHEPEIFARTAKVLLPKDYVRLRLSGVYATDLSDAAGTLWLDVGARTWSDALLEATGLGRSAMPELFEGSQVAGCLRSEIAREWGMQPDLPIAGGAGDQAAGAVGVGVVEPGQAFLALGTSGVYFVAGDAFAPNPKSAARAVHTFCHALPERWHQMSVILSAASCLAWVVKLTGAGSEAALLDEIASTSSDANVPVFLPYLSGERTPHNDPHARGVFFGLDHDTGRAALGRAVLEGVAFALADCQSALLAAGTPISDVAVIGGGARSLLWGRILASVLDRPLDYCAAAEVLPAFGAARLARLADRGEDPVSVCQAPEVERRVEPDAALVDRYRERLALYRSLYLELRSHFAELT